MDVSLEGIEGLVLTEAQQSAISAKFNEANAADVAGLKSKNSELIESMKSGKQVSDELKVENALAAEKLAEAQGNYEEAKRLAGERESAEHLKSKTTIDDLTIQIAASNDRDKARNEKTHVTDAISSFAKEFANETIDIDTLELHLAKHVTMQEVEGVMSTSWGEAGSRDALVEAFRKNPVTARHISGTKATGVGAQGATGTGQAGTVNSKAEEAKKRGDLDGFLRASMAENKG